MFSQQIPLMSCEAKTNNAKRQVPRKQKMMTQKMMTINKTLEPHETKKTRVEDQAPQLRHFVLRWLGTAFIRHGLVRNFVGISEYDEKRSTNDQSGHLAGRIL